MYQLVRILCILPEGIYMSPSKYAYIVLSLLLYTVVAYFTYYILSHTLLFSLNYLGNCFPIFNGCIFQFVDTVFYSLIGYF